MADRRRRSIGRLNFRVQPVKLFVRQSGRQVKPTDRITTNYYSSGNSSERSAPKVKRQRIKFGNFRLLLWLLVAIALIFVVVSLDRHPEVSVDSQQYRSAKTYDEAIDKLFNGPSNRTKLTLNQAAMTKAIQAKFPEVESVQISTPIYSRKPKVNIKIAAPTFTLSGASDTFAANDHYLIAANGKVVGTAANFANIKGLPNLSDQSGYPIKVGQLVLGEGTSDTVLSIIAQCHKFNIPIESFNLTKNQEIDLKTQDKKYYVKFSLVGDAATQIGQFIATRAQLATTGEPSEYLDVRVDGRVFYK